jgi:hypothetical protein
MTFRGGIARNSDVSIRLTATPSNGASAVLLAGAPAPGGAPNSDTTVVAPGGAGAVSVRTGNEGLMQVVTDFKDDHDSGTLEVLVNGAGVDSGRVSGDLTTWTYSVQ